MSENKSHTRKRKKASKRRQQEKNKKVYGFVHNRKLASEEIQEKIQLINEKKKNELCWIEYRQLSSGELIGEEDINFHLMFRSRKNSEHFFYYTGQCKPPPNPSILHPWVNYEELYQTYINSSPKTLLQEVETQLCDLCKKSLCFHLMPDLTALLFKEASIYLLACLPHLKSKKAQAFHPGMEVWSYFPEAKNLHTSLMFHQFALNQQNAGMDKKVRPPQVWDSTSFLSFHGTNKICALSILKNGPIRTSKLSQCARIVLLCRFHQEKKCHR